MEENRITELLNDIYNRYKVVKQVDLAHDIDAGRSDQYCIDNASHGLRFLYGETRKVKPEDFLCITGRSAITGAGVELVPTLNDMTDNRVKRSHILEDKGFRLAQEDFVYLEAIAERDTSFFISIDNEFTHKLFKRQRKKEIFLGGIEYDNPMRKTYTCQIGSSFVTRRFEGLKETDRHDIHFGHEEKVTLGINPAKGYLIMNGQKKIIPKVDFSEKEKLYASVIFNSAVAETEEKKILVSSMVLGKENGYIYLKPHKLEAKNMRVFMIYSGMPEVQYYTPSGKRWIGIKGESQLQVGDLCYIRLAMNNWDCIHNLIITEEGDLR